jgi:5-methylcytosine-specific restriction endonuclease McrA
MIFALQAGRCFYCQTAFTGPTTPNKKPKPTAWTRDHVLPASAGGKKQRNFVFACYGCNQAKRNRMPTKDELLRAATLHEAAVALFLMMNGPNATLGDWRAGYEREEALAS